MSDGHGLEATKSLRVHAIVGVFAVVALLGGLLAWGAATEVSSAVMAPGSFVVAGNLKAVQHPAGGTIETILVAEGDVVSAGQALATLEGPELAAEARILQSRLDGALMKHSRLVAERDSNNVINVPAGLSTEDFSVLLNEQAQLMSAHYSSRDQQISQLDTQIGALSKQAGTLEAERQALVAEILRLEAQAAAVSGSGETAVSISYQLASLQQQKSSLEGQKSTKDSAIAEAAITLSGLRTQKSTINMAFRTSTLEELTSTARDIDEMRAQLGVSTDRLENLTLRAPVSGIVHQLAVHNAKAVLAAGQIAMFVVPQGESLFAEVRVAPSDIDKARLGGDVRLRLSGLNQNTTPELWGTIHTISPTAIVDQVTAQSHFAVTVAVDASEMRELSEGLSLIPGMPVDAYIETGERSVLSYLIKPFADQIAKAFQED